MHEHWTSKGGILVAKAQFKSLSDALSFMDEHRIDKDVYHPYVCSECGMWHIGHRKERKKRREK